MHVFVTFVVATFGQNKEKITICVFESQRNLDTNMNSYSHHVDKKVPALSATLKQLKLNKYHTHSCIQKQQVQL